MKLILASGSPRRAMLLHQLGLDFKITKPDIDEAVFSEELASVYVLRMSKEKFAAIQRQPQLHGVGVRDVVICADTVVSIAEKILGKPENQQHCYEILRRLSGESHIVLTAITVGRADENESLIVETKVKFRILKEEEIVAYWLSGEPQDKAGAYGIQGIGAIFVESITGSYSNVVGLPLAEISQVLANYDISILMAKVGGPT